MMFDEPDGNLFGSYFNSKRLVSIRLERHTNVESLINTLLHECYHAYQSDVSDYLEDIDLNTDLLFLKNINNWRLEKINHQCDYSEGDGEKKYNLYLSSSTEQTARAYAKERLAFYTEVINECN